MSALTLAKPETMFLANYLRQLTQWDDRAAVRVQVRDGVVGFYGGPLNSVISLIAIPLAAATEDIDTTVSAGRLRDIIGDVRVVTGAQNYTLPDECLVPSILQLLPPREGWMPPFKTTAGDLVADVDGRIASIQAQVSLLQDGRRDDAMREQWATLSWSSMPFGMFHVARQLGFFNLPAAHVGASTNGPWKRINTPAGQVFSRIADGVARLLPVRD